MNFNSIKNVVSSFVDTVQTAKSELGGTSVAELLAVVTITVSIGAVAVTSGNSTVLDFQEKGHAQNARVIRDAVDKKLATDGTILDIAEVKTFTLTDIIANIDGDGILDPSSTTGLDYDADLTTVKVSHEENTTTNTTELKFYIKLVSQTGSPNYVYIDETVGLPDASKVTISEMDFSNITIPARSAAGS